MRTIRSLTVALAVLTIACGATEASAQQNNESQELSRPHITVSGTASDDVQPDIAELRINLIEDRPTSVDALAAVAKSTNDLAVDMKSDGIITEDIKTEQTFFQPKFDEEHDASGRVTKRTQVGYIALNSISIKIRHVSDTPKVVSHAIVYAKSGWQSLNYYVSDRASRSDALLARAVENAKSRATLMAERASMKLGHALAIDDRSNGFASQGWAVQGAPGRPREPDPLAVLPGLQHMSATVTVTWELIPQ